LDIMWPVKILLVHPYAEYLKKDVIYLSADCGVLLNKGLREKFGQSIPVLIGCPLLENPDKLFMKIKMIIENTSAKTLNVYSMEVPCCHVIHMMVEKALTDLGKEDIEIKNYIIRVDTGAEEPYDPRNFRGSRIKC